MELSNLEIINSINSLRGFVDKDKPVPYKLSYAINKNLKALVNAIEPFEETRKSIIENNDLDEVKKLEEINAILQEKCNIDLHFITEDVLEKACDQAELSTKDIMIFDFMTKEGE